jgi:hypothetical protein
MCSRLLDAGCRCCASLWAARSLHLQHARRLDGGRRRLFEPTGLRECVHEVGVAPGHGTLRRTSFYLGCRWETVPHLQNPVRQSPGDVRLKCVRIQNTIWIL